MTQLSRFTSLALLVIFSSTVSTLFFTSTTEALTKQQKIACVDRWGGRGTGSAVPDGTPSYNETRYLSSGCDKSDKGNCELERYEDGSAIHCLDPRTGLLDNGVDPTPAPTPTTPGTCSSVSTNIIRCASIPSVLNTIINFLAIGVGIAVVGGIVWGAMLYTTSNGDSGKTQQGITVIVNAVIGLIVFIFMYAIINFIVPGGVL